MPEGDTLQRAAARLRPVLEGAALTDVWFRKLRGHRPRAGDRVASVDAVGKYLVIRFDRPLELHTHLGMAGSWRIQPRGEPLPHTPRLRIVLGTERGRALCFAAPRIEIHVVAGGVAPLPMLGPDLSRAGVDIGAVVARARATPQARTLADLLLDQSVASGIGNVFKSETLFVCRTYPFLRVGEVDDEALVDVWAGAHRLLLRNRSRRRRSTTGSSRGDHLFVYGRWRGGCRICDSAIAFSPAGQRTTRSTYWCPTCQAPP